MSVTYIPTHPTVLRDKLLPYFFTDYPGLPDRLVFPIIEIINIGVGTDIWIDNDYRSSQIKTVEYTRVSDGDVSIMAKYVLTKGIE